MEMAIEKLRPIIDPHLHLWEIFATPGVPQEPQCFLLPQLLETVRASGHAITHSVFVECHQMYRQDGPADLRSLGETEFANGVAAMSASGRYGPARIAHRIVASADLRLGAKVQPVLEAHRAAAGTRFRGIRMNSAHSPHGLFGVPCDPAIAGMLGDPAMRAGAHVLAGMDLSLDIWCVQNQLDEVLAFARAVPDLAIILDHAGTPEAHLWGSDRDGGFADWAGKIRALAGCPNIVVKLGGLGMDISGPIVAHHGPASGADLATRWRPYILTCIDALGPDRAMFESNFPPDQAAGSYGAVWNAFKIIAADLTEGEKNALFRGTAARTYRIAI